MGEDVGTVHPRQEEVTCRAGGGKIRSVKMPSLTMVRKALPTGLHGVRQTPIVTMPPYPRWKSRHVQSHVPIVKMPGRGQARERREEERTRARLNKRKDDEGVCFEPTPPPVRVKSCSLGSMRKVPPGQAFFLRDVRPNRCTQRLVLARLTGAETLQSGRALVVMRRLTVSRDFACQRGGLRADTLLLSAAFLSCLVQHRG